MMERQEELDRHTSRRPSIELRDMTVEERLNSRASKGLGERKAVVSSIAV